MDNFEATIPILDNDQIINKLTNYESSLSNNLSGNQSSNFGNNLHDYNKTNNCGIVEFNFDERIYTVAQPVTTPITVSTPILELDYNFINAYDRVWLSGVLNLVNNNATTAVVRLTITRQSPITATPVIILTQDFVLDNEGDDNQVPVAFSHVDVPNIPLLDVRYRVRLAANIANVLVAGPNTFTAIRFG